VNLVNPCLLVACLCTKVLQLYIIALSKEPSIIEANLALKRAKARLEAIDATSPNQLVVWFMQACVSK
jgi:hypothetical protein